jgi:hypothetical protein
LGGRLDADLVTRHGLEPSAELTRTCSDLRRVKDDWERWARDHLT